MARRTAPSNLEREPKALLGSSGFLLARLGATSQRLFSAELSTLGVKVSHYGLLVGLAEAGPMPQRRLAELSGIDARNLVVLIDELEHKDLVRRVPSETDRRAWLVELTETGRATLRTARRRGEAAERRLLSPLGKDEREELHRLLEKLFDHAARLD